MAAKIRNAFIRVSSANDTLDGLKTYAIDDIQKVIDEWLLTANFLYYFIEHPADDEISQTHWHILIRFPSPTQFETVKNKFPYGKVENARNVKNCIQYMVHLNDVTKKPYSWDEIRTNDKNTDWFKVPSRSSCEIAASVIEEKIVSGEIPQYKQVDMIPAPLWIQYHTRFERAYEFRTKKIVSDQTRKINVVYFSGSTCTGKSTVAELWCKNQGLSYKFSSASNDVMEGYEGQDVLILDDFRGDMEKKGSSRSFNLPDFLKMTDPNFRSSIKSRYYNKDFIGSYIIITSSRPIYDMYFNLEVEDKAQLFRRINFMYQFTKKTITLNEYNRERGKYDPVGTIPNPAADIYFDVKPSQCSVDLASSFDNVATPSDPGDDLPSSPSAPAPRPPDDDPFDDGPKGVPYWREGRRTRDQGSPLLSAEFLKERKVA